MTKKQVKKEEISETQPEAPKEEIEEVEEVESEKPKKKKEVTEAMKLHLANIRVKALKVKQEKKRITQKSQAIRKCRIRIKGSKI